MIILVYLDFGVTVLLCIISTEKKITLVIVNKSVNMYVTTNALFH